MHAQHTVASLLHRVTQLLNQAGVTGTADAELLLGHVLGESRGRVQALAVLGSSISAEDYATVLRLAAERATRVPLQHLTGIAPFRGLELHVGSGVFVPRPETEIVAQLAIDLLQQHSSQAKQQRAEASVTSAAVPPKHQASPGVTLTAVDLCAGSGAIALAIVHEVPEATVWAIEKSPHAHSWARRNVAAFGLGRVQLLLGDAADAATLLAPLRGSVQLLVANPPYVPNDALPQQPEARDHDPAMALYGGDDGLQLVRTISRVAQALVAIGGSLVLEHAEPQGAAIRALLTADGWHNARTHRDLNDRDRATTALR